MEAYALTLLFVCPYIIARQQIGKNFPAASNAHVKVEVLGAVFPLRSVYQIHEMQ
jgi:hypothetical protein